MTRKRVRRKTKIQGGRKKKLTVEEMLAIGRKIRKRIKGPIVDHAELLYDERGLPK
jgi:antitoxin VapB